MTARLVGALLAVSAVAAGSVAGAVLPPQIHTIAGGGSCGAPTNPPTIPSPLASGGVCDGVPATSVSIAGARSVAALPDGGYLYVDAGNDMVREVSPDGTVTTVAGAGLDSLGLPTPDMDGGLAVQSGLNGPVSVAPLPGGGFLITEYNGSVVRMVSPGTPATATITTIAGTGTPGSGGTSGQAARSVQLNYPTDAEPTADGGVLIADTYNNDIKLVSAAAPGATVTTIAGGTPMCDDATTSCEGMPAGNVRLNHPDSVSPIQGGASGYLIGEYDNDAIRQVASLDPSGTLTTVAGVAGVAGYSGDGGAATSALLNHPEQVVSTADGGFLIADTNNEVIRRVSPSGTITTVAGNGVASHAGDGHAATAGSLLGPSAISPTPGGGFLIADDSNNVIRAVTLGPTTTFALSPATPTGQHGWYTSPVHVAVSTTEGAQTSCFLDPDVPPPSFASLPSPCPYAGSGATIAADGAHLLYAASVNSYGDQELPVSVPVNIDTVPPALQCLTPAPTLPLDARYQLVTAAVTDATSGPASTRVSATAPTSTFGTHTVTLTGFDNAGNHATIKCPYTVLPGTLSPRPALASKFSARRGSSTVRALVVTDVPARAAVNVKCSGKSCPFASARDVTGKECRRGPCTAKPPKRGPSHRTVDLTALFAHSQLAAGAQLTVSVTEANTIGRVWLITIVASRPPTPKVNCLEPGATIPGKGCAPAPKPK